MNTRSPLARPLVLMFIDMLFGIAMVPPVIALIPVGLLPTFTILVPRFTNHSSSWWFEDLITNSDFTAATTVPRCSAIVWVCHGIMLNVRIGCICVSVRIDWFGFRFQPFIADESACVSVRGCLVYPADCAATGPLWLAA